MLESYVTIENGGWYLFSSTASLNWIVFELKNARDEKAVVIIDRTKTIIDR